VGNCGEDRSASRAVFIVERERHLAGHNNERTTVGRDEHDTDGVAGLFFFFFPLTPTIARSPMAGRLPFLEMAYSKTSYTVSQPANGASLSSSTSALRYTRAPVLVTSYVEYDPLRLS
jgi:hypothetical protein